MWEIVGEKTDSRWSVDAVLSDMDNEDRRQKLDVLDSGLRRLVFSVYRL
jgi:hypothetical protein